MILLKTKRLHIIAEGPKYYVLRRWLFSISKYYFIGQYVVRILGITFSYRNSKLAKGLSLLENMESVKLSRELKLKIANHVKSRYDSPLRKVTADDMQMLYNTIERQLSKEAL